MSDDHATRLLNVCAMAAKFNADELEALEYIVQKGINGIDKHGHLDLATDPRCWREEGRQELADFVWYWAFDAVQRRRETAARPAIDEVE